MARYLIIALNGPRAGDNSEETYNRWYDDVHVPELLRVPGVVAARRFKVIKSNLQWPYLATYEIETDDFAGVMQSMQAGMGPFDATFDSDNSNSIVAVQILP